MSQQISALLVGDITETMPGLEPGLLQTALPGYSLEFVTTAELALASLNRGNINVLVLNINPGETETLDVLDRVGKVWPQLPVVAVAAAPAAKQASQAIRRGVEQVLIGPIMDAQLLDCAIQCAIERKQMETEWQARLAIVQEGLKLDEALLQVGAALNSTLNYEEVLDLILDKIHLVIPHDAADITLIDGQHVRALRWRGYEKFDAVDYIRSLDFDVDKVHNFGAMKDTRQSLAIPYVEAYEKWVVRPEVVWIKSYIGAPIVVEGIVIGFLNACSTTPGFFDAADAFRLQAFADWAAVAIRNARLYESSKQELAERKRTEMALQHRLMVEELIGAVSTRFVRLDLDAFDPEMEKTLGSVREFIAADRSYLLLFADDSTGATADQYSVERVYEHCAGGIQPSASGMLGLWFSELPWALEQLRAGEAVRVNSAAELPSGAEAERELIHGSHVKSLLLIPLLQGEQLKGCLGVSMLRLARRWTEGDLSLLKLVGEVLFNAVTRKQAEEALRSSEQRYRGLAHENARLLEQASKDAETKSTLLKEVNHRVKNNLTGIIGLLYAEQLRGGKKGTESRGAVLEEMTFRIQGMATVHGMLTANEWAPLPLCELAERVIRAIQQIASRHQQVFVNVEPCTATVTPDEAHSLSLVITELATNSLKYAAKTADSISIDVRITVEDMSIHFLYQDDGPGYSDDVMRGEQESVGLYLIHNIVRRELGGQVELSTNGGAVASISFPSGILRATAQIT